MSVWNGYSSPSLCVPPIATLLLLQSRICFLKWVYDGLVSRVGDWFVVKRWNGETVLNWESVTGMCRIRKRFDSDYRCEVIFTVRAISRRVQLLKTIKRGRSCKILNSEQQQKMIQILVRVCEWFSVLNLFISYHNWYGRCTINVTNNNLGRKALGTLEHMWWVSAWLRCPSDICRRRRSDLHIRFRKTSGKRRGRCPLRIPFDLKVAGLGVT